MTGAEGVNFVTVRIDDKKCERCYECIRTCPNKALTLDEISIAIIFLSKIA